MVTRFEETVTQFVTACVQPQKPSEPTYTVPDHPNVKNLAKSITTADGVKVSMIEISKLKRV